MPSTCNTIRTRHTNTTHLPTADEDMFTAMENMQFSPHMPAEVFACTVGQKPSRAPFYLNDPPEVLQLLAKLVGISLPHVASGF